MNRFPVIPANAGIQLFLNRRLEGSWTPAVAVVTMVAP
jgi:hypothetical protein